MPTFTDHNGDPIVTPCTQVDPEVFFSNDVDEQHLAKRICHTCPAIAQCLQFAQDFEREHGHGYRHGIWAALGPHERSRLTDRRAVA